MNFAERLVAGPPVLATVSRRPAVGDTIYHHGSGVLFEVTKVNPIVVGQSGGYEAVRLEDGQTYLLATNRVTTLTKAEAKAARAHFADLKENT